MTEQETRPIEDAEFMAPARQVSALVLPVAEPADLVDAMKKYQATKTAILHPSDMQDAGQGRTFVKRSGWAKLAIAFGISSEILPGFPKREYDDDGKLVGAECQVRAIAPNGRHADGWGYCAVDEPRFSRPAARQKLQHDLAATSETRARNRAYSNLFGHGEVSAEEIDTDNGKIERAESKYEQRRGGNVIAQSEPQHDTNGVRLATANQLATISKLSRLLGEPEEPAADMTFDAASDRVRDLSREYNERKGQAR